MRLGGRRRCLGELAVEQQRPAEIEARQGVARSEPQRLAGGVAGGGVVAELQLDHRQVVGRGEVVGEHALPHPQDFEVLLHLVGDVAVVVRGDVEPLVLADPVAQLVGAALMLDAGIDGVAVRQHRAEAGMGQREVGVELEGAAIQANRVVVVAARHPAGLGQAEGLEGVERRGGGPRQRHVHRPHRGQRFAQRARSAAAATPSASSTAALSAPVPARPRASRRWRRPALRE